MSEPLMPREPRRAGGEESEDARERARPGDESWQGVEQDWIEGLRERVTALDDQFRAFARREPLIVVGAALAAGFVIGRILRKR